MRTKEVLVVEDDEDLLVLIDLIRDYINETFSYTYGLNEGGCDISERVKSELRESISEILDNLNGRPDWDGS